MNEKISLKYIFKQLLKDKKSLIIRQLLTIIAKLISAKKLKSVDDNKFIDLWQKEREYVKGEIEDVICHFFS